MSRIPIAVLLLALAVGLAACSSSSDPNGIHLENEVVGDEGQGTSFALPCTDGYEPANFPYYSLGSSFQGLALRAIVRECGPAPKTRHGRRTNEIAFSYGTCEASGDSGCPSPLEVQNYPACERPPLETNPQALERIQELPADSPITRDSIELYTRGTTIIVSGDGGRDSRKLVLRAIPHLRAAPPTAAPLDFTGKGGEPLRRNPPLPAIGARGGKRLDCLISDPTGAGIDQPTR